VAPIIEAHGCRVEYLPPYSPDFNPIEYSFSVIKKALKTRHEVRGDESPQEFARLVLRIAEEAVTPVIACNQFRHCHIRID